MLHTIETINSAVNNFIWGIPAMVCIIGVGLYLSIRTHFLHICRIPLTPSALPSAECFTKETPPRGPLHPIPGSVYSAGGNSRNW